MPSDDRTALVVGGGLVGTLTASMLASRGWTVTLVEARTDPRQGSQAERARSINLALSPRGIEALRSVSDELVEKVSKEGIEMRGRMVHKKAKGKGKNGEVGVQKEGQDYGRYEEEGECIRSISRTALGIHLLDHVDGLPKSGRGSVTVRFETKLLEMDLRGEKGVEVVVQKKGEEAKKERFDFVVGGDGAYSKVRREMMRGSKLRFDYKQFYAPHAYLELSIPAGPGDTFLLEPNYLHIWPRGEFMLIALANQDKSFTLTLFAYDSTFSTLEAQRASAKSSGMNPIVELFRNEFPDALEHMGEEALMRSWRENPKDGLVTVECSPYHYEDKVLLVGDAAHAMVPFYGQGMNCGFEDVRVLSSILDHFSASPSPLVPSPLPFSSVAPPLPSLSTTSTKSPLAEALAAYTTLRAPSLSAIQTLAHRNYTEMASSVLSPLYLLRLSLDSFLTSLLSLRLFAVPRDKQPTKDRGGRWESLYRMTTFRPGLAYEEVIRRREWQGKVLDLAAKAVGGAAVVGTAVAVGVKYGGRYRVVRVD
ncbi:hypothetical protein JCM6882_007621 [Rhodosporidiobolus microsporus]